tara:strand:- start:1050 stop:2006 length:957 start_codon:yes stop_codon:yes gene_type:complete
MKNKILITTPISHIEGLKEILNKDNSLLMYENSNFNELISSREVVAVFTNPNQLTYRLDYKFFDLYPDLKVICTASTGTNHIDKKECQKRNIKIISITEERDTINKISSTAEHAFALTLAALRNIPNSFTSVKEGSWSYLPFIGRQISELTFGIIGYGRLGKFYSQYCDAFGSKVIVYDPYKDVTHPRIERVSSLDEIGKESDVISIHAHVNKETTHLLDSKFFNNTKDNVLIVNTSRGEIVDEESLLRNLSKKKSMKYATDVLEGEFTSADSKPLINFAINNPSQIIITPHIAGMTTEAQSIAFKKAAGLLMSFLKK